MSGRQALTEIAQQEWLPFLKEDGWAIDATAGNGFDTEFLARAVGAKGRVYAFDVQDCAIQSTRKRLEEAGLLGRVSLIQTDHAHMREELACGMRGQIQLICFNLGYLPNGDHEITTQSGSTVQALHESLLLLNPGGALSVIAYRGHHGGMAEAESVGRFFTELPSPWTCIRHESTGTDSNPGPVWWMASSKVD
jgi:16S rRNA C1402 N4-methylase RsmH